MSWNDFNAADTQQEFTPIPSGTLARVRLTIKPGGYNDPAQGWTDGMATHNAQKGTVYLSCEFVVLEGQYARRKIWTNIGLYSPSGPNWANMGRSMIKGILNSARGISNKDKEKVAVKTTPRILPREEVTTSDTATAKERADVIAFSKTDAFSKMVNSIVFEGVVEPKLEPGEMKEAADAEFGLKPGTFERQVSVQSDGSVW